MFIKQIEELKAYEIVEKRTIEDLESQSYVLRHKKTGAKIALLSNEDENKVFYIGFRTPPEDSTGVAHILEHSVLCGSKAFPVKDPFIELAKGSLNTFLNAMTFPDKTVYPVASCNDRDFQNLMHVYMDAVFYPNIYQQENIFLQEGWHYEMEDMDAPITVNGVVYSEMKGAFSSPDDVLDREIMNSLYPDTTYSVESGGDPDVIINLTYEDFLAFHKRYYHPCNSYIYLYGNMDMVEKLIWLDEEYLSKFGAGEVESAIHEQKAFTSIREVRKEYPITDTESEKDNSYLSYNVVVENSLDRELYVAFQVLDYCICSAPGAPLRMELIDRKIGKDVYSSYENGICQPFFSIVAKNANEEQKEEFIETIEKVLTIMVNKGINEKSLAAALNYFEFKYREADFGSYPKGLMYGLQILDSWLYQEDLPFIHIEANETFAKLKDKIGTSYFEDLIREYILDNSHKSIVTVVPVKGLAARKEKELEERLARYKKGLGKAELEALKAKADGLNEYQKAEDSKENLEKIPLLTREDIRKEALPLCNRVEHIEDSLFLRHDISTNGIGYVTFAFRCDDIPKELFVYAGILKSALGYMDTEHYSYGELFNEMNLVTGGMGANISIGTNAKNASIIQVLLEWKMKVLYKNMKDAFALVEEILFTTKFEDTKRLAEIISEMKSRMQSRMTGAGHSLAAIRTLSYFSESGAMIEATGGISFYRLLENLEANFESEKEELVKKLRTLMKYIFRPENVIFDYISPKERDADVIDNFTHFREQLYTDEIQKEKFQVTPQIRNEGFKSSAKIQYVCRGGNFDISKLPYTGTLRVLRTIMGYDYLWNNVRVEGGAYGCMCSFSRNGDSYFVSYRDPNLEKTIAVYENVVSYLRDFEADERTMTQFIIGTISSEDMPLSPVGKGNRSYSAYLSDLTMDEIQKDRDELLSTTVEDIRKMADYMEAFLKEKCLCVVGNEEMITKADKIFITTEPLFH